MKKSLNKSVNYDRLIVQATDFINRYAYDFQPISPQEVSAELQDAYYSLPNNKSYEDVLGCIEEVFEGYALSTRRFLIETDPDWVIVKY